MFGNDETRPIGGRDEDDTVITGGADDATSVVDDATRVGATSNKASDREPDNASDDTSLTDDKTVIVGEAAASAPRLIESPLSDDERKRFFRPPVGDPGSKVPIPERPITRPINKIAAADLLADEPPKRKSFDEIIAGEIHRMTDAIPIIGRNRKGEPRRALVAIGLVVALAVVAGIVVAVVINFAF